MQNQKRIAFVDHHLDNFHANTYVKAIRETLKDRGYTVSGCFAPNDPDAKSWSTKHNVALFTDAEELNKATDFYCILAPSAPETHLDLSRRILPFGKTTYIDKTFAPDLATAHLIFELADQHRTKIQTSSALRYTDVQQKLNEVGKDKLRHMIAWGSGSSFKEYAIHPVEMVVSCMGPDCTSLMRRGAGEYSQLLLNFSNERTAVANVYTAGHTPFAAAITTTQSTQYIPVNNATLFTNMAAAILDFFDRNEPQVDRSQTLTIRKILDAANDERALREFVKI